MADYNDLSDGAKALVDSERRKYREAKSTYEGCDLELKELEKAWAALIDLETLTAGIEKLLHDISESMSGVSKDAHAIDLQMLGNNAPKYKEVFDFSTFNEDSHHTNVSNAIDNSIDKCRGYGLNTIDGVFRPIISQRISDVKDTKELAEDQMRRSQYLLAQWGVGLYG